MSNRQKFSAAQYRHHPPAQSRSCLACGQPLGRRRDQPGSRASARYCCSACRQAAFRRRPGGTPKPAVWAWGKVVTQTPPKAEEFQTLRAHFSGARIPAGRSIWLEVARGAVRGAVVAWILSSDAGSLTWNWADAASDLSRRGAATRFAIAGPGGSDHLLQLWSRLHLPRSWG
jgi:hypothetical protein